MSMKGPCNAPATPDVYTLLLLAISGVVGLLGGMTSIGGIMIPPIMITFFGADPHTIMGTTQASFVLPCALAVFLLWRRGIFDLSITLWLALPGAVCTLLSAQYVKPVLDGAVLTLLLSLCIMAAGGLMFKPVSARARSMAPVRQRVIMLLLGSFAGLLAGVTGSGSNAVMVPVMVACGTPLLVVVCACQAYTTVTAMFGTVGNILHQAVDLQEAWWLTLGQLGGIWVGVRIAQRTNTDVLKKIMGGVCLLTGAFMFVRSSLILAG